MSHEHVIPTWLRRELEGGEPGRWLRTKGRDDNSVLSRRMHDHLKVVGDVLCVPCNRGWSARLEESAKPFLLRMMRNQGQVALAEPAQVLVATWLSKTSHLLGYLDGETAESRAVSALRSASAEHRPEDDVAVWVGHFDANPLLRHAWWRKTLGRSAGEIHIITFDRLAAVVLRRLRGSVTDWRISERNDWFIRLWPVAGPAQWPPSRAVTVEHLHGLPGAPKAVPTGLELLH